MRLDSLESPPRSSGQPADSLESPGTGCKSFDRLAWALVIFLLLAQLGMFRQFALREVVWSYPPNHDQLTYLMESYRGYKMTLESGPWDGLRNAGGFIREPEPQAQPGEVVLPSTPPPVLDIYPSNATGFLLPLQASFLYFILGPGRLTALTLNLFYFAVFQCALVSALRWLSGRWSVALIGLGLLLTAITPFFWAGGLMDFRFDFAGFCLFGTFLCAVIRSGMFADRRWSAIAGAVAATLFLLRFLTIVYVGGIMGLLGLFLIARYFFRDRSTPKPLGRQIVNLLIASGIVIAIAVPLLIARFPAIKDYYITGHVTGREAAIRAAEQGVTNLKSRLLYYPHSLLEDHTGSLMNYCGAALLILAAAGLALRRRNRVDSNQFDGWAAVVFVGAALLVPLMALTTDQSKSPVVGGIMVPPLMWLVLLAFVLLPGLRPGANLRWAVRLALPVIALLSLSTGVWGQVTQYFRPTEMSLNRPEIERLLKLYDRLGNLADAMGWSRPHMAFNFTSDAFQFRAFHVIEFERQQKWLDAREALAGTIFGRSMDETMQRMSWADFAVITEPAPPGLGVFEHEFDRGMRDATPILLGWCRQNMVQLQSGSIMGRPVSVFVRPAVRVKVDTDGWVEDAGMSLHGLAEVLRDRPLIELWGPNSAAYIPQAPHVHAVLTAPDHAPVEVSGTLTYEDNNYHLSLRLDPATLPATGKVKIDLTFDASFVPRKINGSADDRKLVFFQPSRAELRQSPK